MTFIVGGLSTVHYHKCLPQIHDQQTKISVLKRLIVNISLVINRLTYFLFHFAYPNEQFLFQKFKTHKFKKISSQTELKAVKKIYQFFLHSQCINTLELENINQELNDVENELNPKREDFQLNLEKKDTGATVEENEEEEWVFEEFETVPLADNVQTMITFFPLNDQQGIHSLFLPQAKDELARYEENLHELLQLENHYRLNNLKLGREDQNKMHAYLSKVDRAFLSSFSLALRDAISLNEKFTHQFSNSFPQLLENGEIICTYKQFNWVMGEIRHRFPAIYQLAFDAPSQHLYQSLRIRSFVQFIMTHTTSNSEKENKSPFFICIDQTRDCESAIQTDELSLKNRSFIHHLFFHLLDLKECDHHFMRTQLNHFISGYTKEWLKCNGTSLQMGGQLFFSGCGNSNWVEKLRDDYTQLLLDKTPQELKQILDSVTECPLIQKIIETYGSMIEREEWKESIFPKTLFTLLFENELCRIAQTDKLIQSIHEIIEDSNFQDLNDIYKIAKVANCSKSSIEPLIRIRVLYVLLCFDLSSLKPLLKQVKRRVRSLYDPIHCKDLRDFLLTAECSERRLIFGSDLDQLEINATIHFKDPYQKRIVAQGTSILKVNSFTQKSAKLSRIDIKNLKFGIYSFPLHTRYLVAQVAPNILNIKMKKLVTRASNLWIVKKAENYHKQKNLKGTVRWKEDLIDVYRLKPALSILKSRIAYLNIQQILSNCGQLSDIDQSQFNQDLKKIHQLYEKTLRMLKELYRQEDDEIQPKIKELSSLLMIKSVNGKIN